MKKKVLDVIREIEAEKRAARRMPDYAIDVEVWARFPGEVSAVRLTLRDLWRGGEIKAGRTLNHLWVRAGGEAPGTKKK